MNEENQPVKNRDFYNAQLVQSREIKNVQTLVTEMQKFLELMKTQLNNQDKMLQNFDSKLELKIITRSEEDRQHSDKIYAIKLVEIILFGILGLFGAGTIGYIVSLLFKAKS